MVGILGLRKIFVVKFNRKHYQKGLIPSFLDNFHHLWDLFCLNFLSIGPASCKISRPKMLLGWLKFFVSQKVFAQGKTYLILVLLSHTACKFQQNHLIDEATRISERFFAQSYSIFFDGGLAKKSWKKSQIIIISRYFHRNQRLLKS